MFTNTIDNKSQIVDTNGNTIIDLTKSIFKKNSSSITSYSVVHLNDVYEMRPDLVSQECYGSTDDTEYILKYSGISNPFSLSQDDILMIPNEDEAISNMATNDSDDTDNSQAKEEQIRNYFKFVNQDYKKDSTTYDNLKNKEIKSAVQTNTQTSDYIVPYISENDSTSITIKNGRMYFGTDTGLNSAEVIKASSSSMDSKIQAVIDSVNTTMSDTNCAYNGLTMANFVRATVLSNFEDQSNS